MISAPEEENLSSCERSCVIRLAAVRARIKGVVGEHATSVLHRGTVDVALSIPPSPIQQTPHIQDELYVIVRGRAVAVHNGEREACETGDLVFVAAGVEHQFEDLSDGFAVWRVFYGPEGGEVL